MDLPKDGICLFIMAFPLPPSFNNASVVSKEPETLPWTACYKDRMDKNSKPTASAHSISLPSVFHPAVCFHALQQFVMMMVMPNPELASENALQSVTSHRPEILLETSPELRV